MNELLNFEGKRAIVTGAASGMGEAAATALVRLGAEVHAVDLKKPSAPVASYEQADLRDVSAIDAAIDAIGGPIDVLMNCAGMPQTFPALDVFLCNFAGLRHLTEQTIPLMRSGSAIVSIASIAGNGWPDALEILNELIDTAGFEEAKIWFEEHPDIGDPYLFAKMALVVYTMRRSVELAKRGIRMNVISPGATETAMKPYFVQLVGEAGFDFVGSVIGRNATPEEQANVMVFLASDAAAYVTGINLPVDGGFTAAMVTGQLQSV